MFFKKKQQDVISFVSDIPGLSSIEECRPQPSIRYLPNWFKNTPRFDDLADSATIKQCPGLVDYFSQGFVVPMWSDTSLEYSKELDLWNVKSGSLAGSFGESAKWDGHNHSQFLKYSNHFFLDKETTFVFKTHCPWRVITKPGWSVYQLPLFYHSDQKFSVMPGVIDTDIHHEINQQVLYFDNSESVFIKRGTPFALYIPFERKRVDFEVRDENENDKRLFSANELNFMTKFTSGGAYRIMQKNRNKKERNG
jgi:hypothetical protein